MVCTDRRTVLASAMAGAAGMLVQPPALAAIANATDERFRCPPCGCSMDNHMFLAPGKCPDCGMILQPGQETDLGHAPDRLAARAGYFTLAGKDMARIRIDYYKPDNFTATSPILLVVPGAGRDSDEYRNAWLETAWSTGTLVAALGYPEADYDFSAYHMGGVIRDLRFDNMVIERPDGGGRVIRMRDEDIRFSVNPDRASWLFGDFDRVFDHIVTATGSRQQGYDIFGHSAGGQILHRLVLFHPQARAGRIIAANAGFYTLPDLAEPLPTGLADTGLTEADLKASLGRSLVLLLGEKDDNEGAGGTFLRTPATDRQGPGRLQRGRYFHRTAQRKAAELGIPLQWQVQTVPGAGHDFAAMTRGAAKLLYG
ncbi:MAG: hypothetical protein AAFX04_14300 [Pseudomonadota bacterium]